MRTIWKFPIPNPGSTISLEMPLISSIIKVTNDAMWAIVDPASTFVIREFVTVATGQEWSINHVYIGTWFEEPFVWHILERRVQ